MSDDDVPEQLAHPDPVPGFAPVPSALDASAPPTPRKRGWPKGVPRGPRRPRADADSAETAADRIRQGILVTPPDTQVRKTYDRAEVQHRLEQVVLGLTGLPGAWRPYFQATPTEAQNIADPLASYLIRRADDSAVVRAILDEYDLVVFVLALVTYAVRVIHDHRAYAATQKRLMAARVQAMQNARAAQQQTDTSLPIHDAHQVAPDDDAVPVKGARATASAPAILDI